MDGNSPFYNNPRFTAGNAPFNNCPNGNCQRVEAGSQRSCCPGGVCCPNGRCPQREQAPRQQQQQQQQQPQHPVWNSNNGRWQ